MHGTHVFFPRPFVLAVIVAGVPSLVALAVLIGPRFTALNYPRVDGSTSAQPLGLIIACKVLSSPYRWAPD